ncbi:IS5 family transposase (plasmid) [Aromatoleum buckelii]|nr:IS5 family transposase [Aromatoleum buckelii]MCK0509508.1 IS5 family transposase [Aromatoleum buckelii]
MTSKLHFAVDALGKPLGMILTAGQIADIECAHDLITGIACVSLVADKGYDANALIHSIHTAGAKAVIPPRYDRSAYRARNLIERFFNRIQHFRHIATRHDKLAATYMAFVRVVCAVISYRYM